MARQNHIWKEITQYLGDRDHGTAGEDQTILDPNHFARRMFRCWLDGSYLGESHYHSNCNSARDNYNDDKALRRVVIHEFIQFIEFEFSCLWSTARGAIIESVEDIEALNIELIDDLRELVRDEMQQEEVA